MSSMLAEQPERPRFSGLRFIVYGRPQTAGSKRAFALRRRDGTPVMRGNSIATVVTDDNPESRGWKREVAHIARERLRVADLGGGPIFSGDPVELHLTFFRPRPKGHFKRDGGLTAGGRATPFPTSKPDVLKLARAVEDALTGVVWRDDAQVVVEFLSKRWGEPARVEIEIRRAV